MNPVRLSGLSSRTGELTFGQQYIWEAISRTAPHDHHFSMGVVYPVAPGTTATALRQAVGSLIAAYESLRTTYVMADDGTPRQIVAGEGDLPVEWHPAQSAVEASDAAEELRLRLAGKRFDLRTDWPVRIGVVTVDGMPSYLILVVSHIASDARGLVVMGRFLAGVLDEPFAGTGSRPRPITRQPLDQAEYERAPEARREHERALRYWRSQLMSFPDRLLRPAARPETPRYWHGLFRSPAAIAASQVLARRHRVTNHSVLLAASARLLAHLAGREECAFAIMSGNRQRPALEDAVMNLPQRVPLILDVRGGSFRELARRAQAATLNACQYGQYPPAAVRRVIEEVERERGIQLDLTYTFNAADRWMAPAPRLTGLSLAGLRTLTQASTFEWIAFHDEEKISGYLNAGAPDWLSLFADTTYLPPRTVEGFLRGIESLLIAAVEDDDHTTHLARIEF